MPHRTRPKVLLVDDEKLNLLTFEAFLSEDGYELHVAEDGRTALEMARRLSPDLVLLDIMMPEMDGYTVCRRIRADPGIGRVPVIIVTALHDSASRLEALRAGADDFVTKPCSREEMRARVRTVVSLNRFRVIAEQRERFERLYNLAPIAILLTDPEGTIAAANPRAHALLGGDEGRLLIGQPLPTLTRGSEEIVGDIIRAALAGSTTEGRELREETAGRGRVWRVDATAVPDAGGHCAMLMFSDVTAEVRARDALASMNRELDQLVRARTHELEEANSLLLSYASFVSHDLRSPLTVVKGYLSMIQEGAVPLVDSRELIEAAYKSTVTMEEMVRNILQLAHDQHGGMRGSAVTEFDPTSLVERVWTHVVPIYPHPNRKFKVAALPSVAANPILVERVFYNLLTNAAKYSAQREEAIIEVGVIPSDAGPTLFVRDNGIGFETRDADKLFQEFSRLPNAPSGDGFGLGLSLVSRLLRAHGGKIWAEGTPNGGATFFVRFAAESE